MPPDRSPITWLSGKGLKLPLNPARKANRGLAGAAVQLLGAWVVLVAAGALCAEPGQPALDTSRGVFWQVDSPGGATSYLFGTIHVGEPAILQLPRPVQDAFDQSERLVVELVLQPEDFLEIGRRMRLPGSQNLAQVIGPSLYARVLHAAHSRDLDQQISRLHPWAVATLLFAPDSTGLPVLDLQLQRSAIAAGKPVVGLESLDEQLAVFEQLGLDDQIDLLHEAVLASVEFEVGYGELLVAYMNRDLARIVQLSRLHLAQDARLKKTLQYRLVIERNRRMLRRLLPMLETGGVFVAVGVLHLPGESGLLTSLFKEGYRVTRRY